MSFFSKWFAATGRSRADERHEAEAQDTAEAKLERLGAQCVSGRLSHAEAAKRARAEIAPLLSLSQVDEGAERQSMLAIGGEWQKALAYFQLLLEAIDARGESAEREAIMRAAVIPYLYAVGAAVAAVPDGRVFADARQRGETLADRALSAGALSDGSEILHRLGVLHLDPFCAGRTPQNFQNEDGAWRARLAALYGPAIAASDEAKVPEAAAAVESAIGYFERAMTMRTGRPRGFTLKALCQALLWREHLGGAPDRARVEALANEAIPLMPDDYRLELQQLAQVGARGDPGGAADTDKEADELLAASIEEMIEARGARRTIDRYKVAANATADRSPLRAIALVARIWPYAAGSAWAADRHALATCFAGASLRIAEQAGCAMAADEPADDAYRRFVERVDAGTWAPEIAVAALIGLLVSSQSLDREAEAIPYSDGAIQLARDQLPAFEGPVSVLRAALFQGAGVNAFNAGDFSVATSYYVQAASAYASADMVDQALAALRLAQDAMTHDGGGADEMVAGLIEVTPLLLNRAPLRVSGQLRQYWEAAIASALQLGGPPQPLELQLCWFALQGAKGADFAVRSIEPGDYDWRSDPEAAAMLGEILEMGEDVGRIESSEAGLNMDMVLSAFDSPVGTEASDDRAQLRRLRQRFDEHLLTRSRSSAASLQAIRPIDDVRALLDPETAFLTQYLGRTLSGELAFVTLILTREDEFITFGKADLPQATIVASHGDQSAELSWFGFWVAALREEIVSEPGPDPVSPRGAELLQAEFSSRFGGGIAPKLDSLYEAGKRHLCIHPHDAFHFAPQHLAETGEGPLADRWTVTYVPHPALLQRRGDGEGDTGDLSPVIAVGMGYGGGQPHGQAPLPAAAQEARAVAQAVGGTALIDSEATEQALAEAIGRSRRLHIACHGRMDYSAPAFQCLFLQPDGDQDGLFHAYELVGRDLRHLDLVTLSACETALGRFDPLDNLRGLAAGFFSAGARTVISTLWPVLDEASSTFFQTLYEQIGEGESKLGAFRHAQEHTRSLFRQYRDWGAFHFAGAW